MNVIGTSADVTAFILQHLHDDLEVLATTSGGRLQPCIPPAIVADGLVSTNAWNAAVANGAVSVSTRLVLQVVAAEDVGMGQEARWRAAAGSEAEVNGDDTEAPDAPWEMGPSPDEAPRQQRRGGGRWRYLKLILTDGFTRIIAIERILRSRASPAASNAPIFPNGVTLGEKVQIRELTHPDTFGPGGVLRVHHNNLESLGGSVRALQMFAALEAQTALAKLTGKPPRLTPKQAEAPVEAAQPSTGPPASAAPPPASAAAVPSLRVQQLEMWKEHAEKTPDQPFLTEAVITEVVSDLLINESNTPSTAGTVQAPSVFSMMVMLSPPIAAEQTNVEPSVMEKSLVVDLGDAWLRSLVGMTAAELQALSVEQQHNPQAQERLGTVTESVGQALESLQVAKFKLWIRPTDHVIEVLEVSK